MGQVSEHVQTRQIAVGICVEEREAGVHVLISRRPAGGVLAGFWEFPGGKVEAGESVRACVERELREELGIEVTAVEPLDAIEFTYAHGAVRLEPWLCRRVSGEPQALGVAEWRWVRPNELSAFEFPPANAPLTAEVMRRLGDAQTGR